jgi:hypothetical protein
VGGRSERWDRPPLAGAVGLVDAVAFTGVEVQFDAIGVLQHEQPPDRCVDDGRVVDAEFVEGDMWPAAFALVN